MTIKIIQIDGTTDNDKVRVSVLSELEGHLSPSKSDFSRSTVINELCGMVNSVNGEFDKVEVLDKHGHEVGRTEQNLRQRLSIAFIKAVPPSS